MHLSRFAGTVVVLGVLLGPSPRAAGRVVRLNCRDGIPPLRTMCAEGCVRPVRCDVDLACDDTCTFAIRVCREIACLDRVFPVGVGQRQKIVLVTAFGASATRFALRCREHPAGVACPTTSTTSTSTTTSTPILACPTTTTLGVPSCGGVSLCIGPCLSGQACADLGNGQCGCTGPVLCGGTYSTCGGECAPGQSCTQLSVPDGCPSIGCTCSPA